MCGRPCCRAVSLSFYDLYRGIARHLAFDPDAAAGELPRAITALGRVPAEAVVVGDRLYGVGRVLRRLADPRVGRRVSAQCRQSWRWVRDLRQAALAGGELWETVVELPGKGTHPSASACGGSGGGGGREVHELLTKVLEPTRLTAEEALTLYPWRWKVERLFFDLKEVLQSASFLSEQP